MRFTSQTSTDGVSQHLFTLGEITGALWTPAAAADAGGSRPLVLLGHGGGQHKKAPGLIARAYRYVTGLGFAVAAVDAPGHGDRRAPEHEPLVAAIRERVAAGEPPGPHLTRYHSVLAAQAVPEWVAVLDALQRLGQVGPDGPVGFSGLSMGTGLGVPFVAAEPRIAAAVFGLAAHDTLAEAATRITIPVQFLLQWDDEFVPRDSGLALFDAFSSREKTLHANPGRHGEVPAHELESSERFFARHLLMAG